MLMLLNFGIRWLVYLKISAMSRNHPIGRPVMLAGIQIGITGMGTVEHLQLAHSDIGGITDRLTGWSRLIAVICDLPASGTFRK